MMKAIEDMTNQEILELEKILEEKSRRIREAELKGEDLHGTGDSPTAHMVKLKTV